MRVSVESNLRGTEEIAAPEIRQSAITSQSIGVRELELVMAAVPLGSDQSRYEAAIVDGNVLGLKTTTAREWRFKTLRRLYQLTPDSMLFRAMSDLWPGDPEAHPLLAGLCALATDTVFRSTADFVLDVPIGDEVGYADFVDPIEERFPGAYQESTTLTIAQKAYASWGQTGHLGEAEAGNRLRTRPVCRPENAAFALLLGHLQGQRGEALFDTVWARVLDHPRSHLYDLALAASQRGMLEFRNAGGVVEVGFRELLRPMEGELL